MLNLRRRQGLLPPPIDTLTLGGLDALPLAFLQQLPLKLREGPHDGEEQLGHGGVLAGEGQAFFDKLDPDAPTGQACDQLAQIVEVAGEAVEGVDDDGIALAGELQQGLKLGAVDVLAADLVGKGLVNLDAVELTVGVLVEAADANVAEALASAHAGSMSG